MTPSKQSLARLRIQLSSAAPFKIDGVYCRLIPLTHNQFAIITAKRYDDIGRFFWYAWWCDETKSYYAVRNETGADGRRRTIKMSRYVLAMDESDKRLADHKNGVTLDNRDDNLRPVSTFDSAINRKTRVNNKSGCKGIYACKIMKQWRVYIYYDGKRLNLGWFRDLESAKRIRKAAEAIFHGEFSRPE